MSKLRTELAEAFGAAVLRPTPQRYAVLEFLVRHPVHAKAAEVYAGLNRNDARTSRATVYNGTHTLTHSGLVRQVISDGKAARYDANVHQHHHFVCDRCGVVEDIEWFGVPAAAGQSALGRRPVRTYELLFRGIWEFCRSLNLKNGAR